MLVHPEVRGVYLKAVGKIASGLRVGGIDDLAVCSLKQFNALDHARSDVVIFAVGDRVGAEFAEKHSGVVVGVLVTRLHRSMKLGISLFVDPGDLISRVEALKPDIEAIHLVHLAEAPAATVAEASAAARRAGLTLKATSVTSVREAAKLIDRLKSTPSEKAAIWFHNGVLGLNPDVLAPALVRVSWDRKLFVVADDAAYVERGILMSVSPDLRSVGIDAAQAVRQAGSGLRHVTDVQWGVNRRSAIALGVDVRGRRGPSPDFVYE